jgi:hypothetical protein
MTITHILQQFIELLAKNEPVPYICIIVLGNILLGDEIGRHALLSRG